MTASTAAANSILNHLLRGVAMSTPDKIFVSLHTSNPGLNGSNEVTTSKWPSYVRSDAGTAANKKTKNAKQILWPPYNGSGTITITHLGIWTAQTGGVFLMSGALSSAKTLSPSDEIVIHVNALTVEVN